MKNSTKLHNSVDSISIPRFDLDFDCSFNEVFGPIAKSIHNNPNISKDIKDAWIEIFVINNIDKLYELPY